jgi:hypothetical protein
MKFNWRGFLSGAICNAIIVAGGVWWKSTHVDDWVLVQDLQIYDICLASGYTSVACDAMMGVLARARAEAAEQSEEGGNAAALSPPSPS